ncbi:MAG: Uncharacterized protein XD43_1101 [Thermococcales archaeon 44_46]|jgi:uncharacterized cysteine cluster protein YcgN (CxxCxxCC family)|uniref:hypothetical protein n=1 Tax=Thermococcus TaxID=2263 RepID=UPI000747DAAF|nr:MULTISPECIES: hypothetical protein [Thermococcus]KUJ99231.1 MAG: Uncharacterized protein XD43_1101 [Thermococcales archaeon 44_46]MDK2783627.1 hypothetical protein [Thermococcaceae archaeon]MCA6212904.1 hypothetical protein [Thermococcus bergensis]MDK2853299.1 hypothetical protein [Thermococcaceae archaeon]MDK2983464.1 hypothetical protein [Thermococcaceae archaeon]
MKIIELDIKLPYDARGKVLSKILSEVRGKIKDIHFLPPTCKGVSEIRMEVAEENVQKLLEDLKKIIKDGKISFKILSEA